MTVTSLPTPPRQYAAEQPKAVIPVRHPRASFILLLGNEPSTKHRYFQIIFNRFTPRHVVTRRGHVGIGALGRQLALRTRCESPCFSVPFVWTKPVHSRYQWQLQTRSAHSFRPIESSAAFLRSSAIRYCLVATSCTSLPRSRLAIAQDAVAFPLRTFVSASVPSSEFFGNPSGQPVGTASSLRLTDLK